MMVGRSSSKPTATLLILMMCMVSVIIACTPCHQPGQPKIPPHPKPPSHKKPPHHSKGGGHGGGGSGSHPKNPPPVIITPPPVIVTPPVVNPPPETIPPPVTYPPYTPGPPSVTPAPPAAGKTCPIDALKLGLCVDVLGGLVHIGLGDPVENTCCPVLGGLLELEAAVCLCTAIRIKLLNLNIFIPLALQALITCGKTPPPGFICPPL